MADDRLYLQCNICGAKFFMGKQFAWGAFYLKDYAFENETTDKPFVKKLNDFYEAHYHPEADVCYWNGNYSIIYETDDWKNLDEIAVPSKRFRKRKDCETCRGLPICEKNRKDK